MTVCKLRLRHWALISVACLAGCASPRPLGPGAVAPPEVPSFSQTGLASWYGSDEQGEKTADGERYDMHDMTAAHLHLSFRTIARVTRVDSGKTIKVRINDRGPHEEGRIIDLSSAAATALGMRHDGVMTVRVEVFASDQLP